MAANHQWALGDLAIKVSALKVRGERTLERYAERIGVEYSTLQVYHAVAQKWPENLPRGRFSVCRELMTHPDRAALITADPQMRVRGSARAHARLQGRGGGGFRAFGTRAGQRRPTTSLLPATSVASVATNGDGRLRARPRLTASLIRRRHSGEPVGAAVASKFLVATDDDRTLGERSIVTTAFGRECVSAAAFFAASSRIVNGAASQFVIATRNSLKVTSGSNSRCMAKRRPVSGSTPSR